MTRVNGRGPAAKKSPEFDPRDTALGRWLLTLGFAVSYVGQRCFTPSRRAWLYRVLLAVVPVAGAYGLVTDKLAVLWVVLAAAVLGQGVAAAHTPTRHASPPIPRVK